MQNFEHEVGSVPPYLVFLQGSISHVLNLPFVRTSCQH